MFCFTRDREGWAPGRARSERTEGSVVPRPGKNGARAGGRAGGRRAKVGGSGKARAPQERVTVLRDSRHQTLNLASQPCLGDLFPRSWPWPNTLPRPLLARGFYGILL